MGSILDIKSPGLGSAVRSVKRGSKKVDKGLAKAHRKVRKHKPKVIYMGKRHKKK
jgi:hypothetical protein